MATRGKILVLYKWPTSRATKFWSFAKAFIKEGLGYGNWQSVLARRGVGGNITLPKNVVHGLSRLGADFVENDFDRLHEYYACYVIKDVRCLRWAIEQKRLGRIGRLIAGPLIVNFPFEEDRVIESPLIDTYILHSNWIKNLFEKLSPEAHVNYKVWPSGVDVETWLPGPEEQRKKWIVYVKNPEPGLLREVVETLRLRNIPYELLRAGHFNQGEYFEHLQQAAAVIYLSRSETQGFAMFEAWSCNVPTLHWDPGEFRLLNHVYPGASSCPYLTSECGHSFAHAKEFDAALTRFMGQMDKFHPRQYVESNFTIVNCVERLLEYSQQT